MEPGTMKRMVAFTESSSNQSYVEPSPYAWLRTRAPVPTTYAPACDPLYPFQEILENRTSRARGMTGSCTEVPERKFAICIEMWQFELESCVWRVSFHKYAYVHGDPVQGIDPTGEFLSGGGLGSFFMTVAMGPPGVGDSIQGALQSLVTAYAINLEWDINWALDWSLADDLNTRQDNSWVTEALIRGAIQPWEEFLQGIDLTSGQGGGPILAAAARPGGGGGPRVRFNGPSYSRGVGTSIPFRIGSTRIHAVSLGRDKGHVFHAPDLGKPIRFDGPHGFPADGRLAAKAKLYREKNGLMGPGALAGKNVGVAKIRVNGEERFITEVSSPRGHSEELLAQRVRDLRADGKKVEVDELFTERIPCTRAGCRNDIQEVMPDAKVFFFSRNSGLGAKNDLMTAYRL